MIRRRSVIASLMALSDPSSLRVGSRRRPARARARADATGSDERWDSLDHCFPDNDTSRTIPPSLKSLASSSPCPLPLPRRTVASVPREPAGPGDPRGGGRRSRLVPGRNKGCKGRRVRTEDKEERMAPTRYANTRAADTGWVVPLHLLTPRGPPCGTSSPLPG